MFTIHFSPQKYIYFTLCLLWFAMGCVGNKTDESEAALPESVIQPAAMVNLLTDLHLAEAMVQSDRLRVDSLKRAEPIEEYYHEVFALHGVTTDQFRRSLDFYLTNEKQFESLYNRVVNRFSQLEAKLRAE